MSTPSKIPVTVISGFLGSGKTTLLNRILKAGLKTRFALIINELGEIGIDQHLIPAGSDFVALDNGCLCCALNEDLVKTIESLTKRNDYDAVIIETTGIADPLATAWTFTRPQFKIQAQRAVEGKAPAAHEVVPVGLPMEGATQAPMIDQFRIASLICVVDALHFDITKNFSRETETQIASADILYVTKTDLADLQKIIAELKTINPHAIIVDAQDKNALDILFDEKVESNFSSNKLQITPLSHTNDYKSISLDLSQDKVTLSQMEDRMTDLPAGVIRAKAVFKDSETGKIYIMHRVASRLDFYEEPDYVGPLALITIGKGFEL